MWATNCLFYFNKAGRKRWGKKETKKDPAIPLLHVYPKEPKTLQRGMCIYVLFTIANIWRQLGSPSVDEWIKERWYIYIMQYYSAIQKEWNLATCDSMDGPRGCTEWSKSDGERQMSYDLTYIWTLENRINKQKQKQVYKYWEHINACQIGE